MDDFGITITVKIGSLGWGGRIDDIARQPNIDRVIRKTVGTLQLNAAGLTSLFSDH